MRPAGRTIGWLLGLAFLGGLAAAPATGAAGGDSPPDTVLADTTVADTTLGGFLRTLSDSTDRYFGDSAAPPDTAGQDSALAYGLTHRPRARGRSLRPGLLPRFAFNRVEGPVWGGALGVGEARRIGKITGTMGYAAGPNEWQGGGEYDKSLRQSGAQWSLRVFGGRWTSTQDRDFPERHQATLRALVSGRDYQRYYRRDGIETEIKRETATVGLLLGFRRTLDSPLATTTTWNLLDRDPVVTANPPAARGRMHEFSYGASWRLPGLPVTAAAIHQTSGHAIGSQFEYRRTRVAVAGNFGLGRLATLVPQVAYGRLTGTVVPQAAFYLGGVHSLRSLIPAERGGTGDAIARLDLLGAGDALAWAHVPHPAAFPIGVGLFGAVGAVWGADPNGGPARPGVGWPHAEDWLSEAGLSAFYQPGFPDPAGMIRLDLAWPLGPGDRQRRWSVAYTRPLDLLNMTARTTAP